jgi:hypothetical protein
VSGEKFVLRWLNVKGETTDHINTIINILDTERTGYAYACVDA